MGNPKNPYDRHPFFEQISQLWRNKTAIIGLIIISGFFLVAIFAPILSPHDPLETSLYDQIKPPVWHPSGMKPEHGKTSWGLTNWDETPCPGSFTVPGYL